MVHVTDRPGTPLLGERSRAEKLVDWSIEKAAVGTRYSKKFPCGLTLNFVADGTAPKMYIHWNPKCFKQFVARLGEFERLVLSCWGIAVESHKGKVSVKLLGAGTGVKDALVLWSDALDFCKEQAEQDVDFLTGMVRFAETGPIFLEEIACQQELEEASALAVIRLPKRVSAPVQRLPKKVIPKLNLPANLKDLLRKNDDVVV